MERKKIKGFIASLLIVFASSTAFGTDRDVQNSATDIQAYEESLISLDETALRREINAQFLDTTRYCSITGMRLVLKAINIPFSAMLDLVSGMSAEVFAMSGNSLGNSTQDEEGLKKTRTQEAYQELKNTFVNESLDCQRAYSKLEIVDELLLERGIDLADDISSY